MFYVLRLPEEVIKRLAHVTLVCLYCLLLCLNTQAQTRIEELKRDQPVDFATEILPVLRQNCLACHNKKKSESELILETVADILKGGAEGKVIDLKNPADSTLLKLSAHLEEPVMPPEDNDVLAQPLTSVQLGLIKLWITQGAKPGDKSANAVQLQKLPPGVSPIYALAMSPNGQLVAVGRANQVSLYHIPAKREIARFSDPALIESGLYQNPGEAHLDVVQSVAFSADNRTVATGGFKTVKLWKQMQSVEQFRKIELSQPATTYRIDPASKRIAVGYENGLIEIRDASGKVIKSVEGHASAITAFDFSAKSKYLFSAARDKTVRAWEMETGKQTGRTIELASPASAICFASQSAILFVAGQSNTIDGYALSELLSEPTAENTEPIKPSKILQGHGKPVEALVLFSEDGQSILSSSDDGNARIWNTASGKSTHQFNHGQPISHLAINTEKTIIATAAGSSVKLWKVADRKMIAEVKGDIQAKLNEQTALAELSLQKRYVDLAMKDTEAEKKLKTAEDEKLKKDQEALKKADEEFKKKVAAVKTAQDSKNQADAELKKQQAELAAAEQSFTTISNEVKTASDSVNKSKTDQANASNALVQSQQAADSARQKLAASQEQIKKKPEDEVLKKQFQTHEEQVKMLTQVQKEVEGASQLAKTKLTAATKSLADLQAKLNAVKEQVNKLKKSLPQAEKKSKDLEQPLKTANDDQLAAQRKLDGLDRSIQRTKAAIEKSIARIPELEKVVKELTSAQNARQADYQEKVEIHKQSQKPFSGIAFSGEHLLASSEGNRLLSWNSDLGIPLETFEFSTIADMRSQKQGLVGLAVEKRQLLFFRPQSAWNLVRTIGRIDSSEFSDRVTSLAFSPDGSLLATGGGQPSRAGELKIWDVKSGNLRREIQDAHSDTVLGIAFSPNGKQIASCSSDRLAKTFSVATGEHQQTLEGHTHHVLAVAWSADNRLIATAGADKVIKVWNVGTWDNRKTITGFENEITSVRFLGTETTLVSSCGDGTVRTSDSGNGNQVRRFAGFSDFVYAVDSSRDTNLLAAGGHDGMVRIWDVQGTVIAEFAQPETK